MGPNNRGAGPEQEAGPGGGVGAAGQGSAARMPAAVVQYWWGLCQGQGKSVAGGIREAAGTCAKCRCCCTVACIVRGREGHTQCRADTGLSGL
jgi:hypothetical protein